ncbi:MAG: excinuclease ABC subunit A [Tabrizicola sp.]|jgi:hypothetical protein|nr:excinuclease ABC subunit A [Tabrizicola sp.]
MTAEQKGLRFAAGVTCLTGLALALSAWPPLAAPLRLLADLLIWPLDSAQTLAAAETRLMLAISGGVLAGWGAMIWQLAGSPFARSPAEVRRVILISVLTWFVIDSAASVLAGATLNVAANLVFLALFLVPMRLARRTAAMP